VMEQLEVTDPGLAELRRNLFQQTRAGCAVWISQLGPKALRPGLTEEEATDVMLTVQAPYLYSMFTVNLGWSADQYEEWLAHAMPRLLLRPELLTD
jgi:hypothetical protein